MKSRAHPDFWRAFDALPTAIQERARRCYQIWSQDRYHPSLRFKKVGADLWSARVTPDYRALALETEAGWVWIWIGSHADYEGWLA